MKAIIQGKRYNTESATMIGDYSNGYGAGDFRSVDEALWKTPNGRYFLAGRGGPMTRYSSQCGDMTGGGSKIIPLSDEEAYEWTELHCPVDVLEEHFGAILSDA